MQGVRTADKEAILVLSSDWHFRLTTPRSRAEEDWKLIQTDMAWEVTQLCRKHHCPLLLAGDIFDDGWRADKCSPELINFAYEVFCLFPKEVIVVAGQHDLPNHRFDQLGKSALHTLACTGKVTQLSFDHPFYDPNSRYVIQGTSWNEEDGSIPDPVKMRKDGNRLINVFVTHANVWHHERTRYKDAPETEFTDAWRKKLKGYDVAVFGDNHKGFLVEDKPIIYNTGGPLNRNSDEKGVKKHVGILYSDGSVEKHYLNQTEKWKDAEDMLTDPAARLTDTEFITDLAEVGPEFLDFCASVLRHLRKKDVRDEVQAFVTNILKLAKKEEK